MQKKQDFDLTVQSTTNFDFEPPIYKDMNILHLLLVLLLEELRTLFQL